MLAPHEFLDHFSIPRTLSSRRSAREPPVPISIPKSAMTFSSSRNRYWKRFHLDLTYYTGFSAHCETIGNMVIIIWEPLEWKRFHVATLFPAEGQHDEYESRNCITGNNNAFKGGGCSGHV